MFRFIWLTMIDGGEVALDYNSIVRFSRRTGFSTTFIEYVNMTKEGGSAEVVETPRKIAELIVQAGANMLADTVDGVIVQG